MTSTDLFENARFESPGDNTCEWVPRQMNSDWTRDSFDDMTTEQLRTSVHRHLAILEDFDARHESRYIRDAEVWAKNTYDSAPDHWKRLFAAAWSEDQEYQEPFACPSYWRPSLFLLHGPWMVAHGHDAIALPNYASRIWWVVDAPVEEQLLWPA